MRCRIRRLCRRRGRQLRAILSRCCSFIRCGLAQTLSSRKAYARQGTLDDSGGAVATTFGGVGRNRRRGGRRGTDVSVPAARSIHLPRLGSPRQSSAPALRNARSASSIQWRPAGRCWSPRPGSTTRPTPPSGSTPPSTAYNEVWQRLRSAVRREEPRLERSTRALRRATLVLGAQRANTKLRFI